MASKLLGIKIVSLVGGEGITLSGPQGEEKPDFGQADNITKKVY